MKRISPRWRSFAARLRGNHSDAEQRLWEEIRDGQIKGWKFRRQHPIGRTVVDFCCLEGMLIIELDGGEPREHDSAGVGVDHLFNGFRISYLAIFE